MTTLAITPNWKNKSAKFKGTVAAGEHVSVTILNDDGEGGEFIDNASTLRLRVVNPCNGRTLAIFPEPVPEGETPETWDSDLSPLRCTLNLNTVQMLKAVPPAANVPLLFVLDDYENKTLYFKEQFEVTHWPRLRGEEEPTDLDDYKDIIADFNTRLDGYDSRITAAENAAQAASTNASTAISTANQAVDTANQAVDKAETAQNSAAASAEAAAVAQVAAEAAQVAAEEAAESINSPDATLSEAGVAADAKATGDAIADEETRATAAEAAEETRAKGVESGLRTDLTAAQKAIDDEATLRAAADADLDATKADKATTYTKTETDAKIAGFVDGAEYVADYGTPPKPTILLKHGTTVVGTVDATDFVIDGMVSSVEIEDGNLVITFNTDAGQEPIEIPLTDIFDPDNYYNKTAVDALLAAKADKATTYTKTETDGLLVEKLSLSGGTMERSAKITWSAGGMLGGAEYSVSRTGVQRSSATPGASWTKTWDDLATTADATLTERGPNKDGFSSWDILHTPLTAEQKSTFTDSPGASDNDYAVSIQGSMLYVGSFAACSIVLSQNGLSATYDEGIDAAEAIWGPTGTTVATRTVLPGYQLGSQDGKPLASEAEAEALRTGKADRAASPTAGNLAALDSNGSPTDSGIKPSDKLDASSASAPFSSDSSVSYPVGSHCTYNGKLYVCTTATTGGTWDSTCWRIAELPKLPAFWPFGNLVSLGPNAVLSDSGIAQENVALKDDIPYSLGTPITIDTASSETVEGETVYYGAATLVNRTANIVQVTAATALDELRITLPAATSGKVRDFGLRVEIGTGSAALTAPALVPVAPTGETIKLENADGTIPELADGTATAKGVTLLYFSETSPGVFVVKGEQVEEVA